MKWMAPYRWTLDCQHRGNRYNPSCRGSRQRSPYEDGCWPWRVQGHCWPSRKRVRGIQSSHWTRPIRP